VSATQRETQIDSPYMIPADAAIYCRVDTTTIWRAQKSGVLKACGPGSAVRYHRDDLDNWMRSRNRT
jgi:excisionase family DNA binding protein